MYHRYLVGLLLFVLFEPCSTFSTTFIKPDSTNQSLYDTVFVAPDTIRNVFIDTVYEYEQVPVQPKQINKKAAIAFLGGTQAGVEVSHFYPLYKKTDVATFGAMQGMLVYDNLFLDLCVAASGREQASVHFTRQYTNYRHYTDTIKTILDQYYEIKGKDTTVVQVIKKTPVHKTDTLRSDSSFTHKNSYSTFQIPLLFGYCFKTKTTWLGFGIGPSLRITMAQSSNKIVSGDSSFVSESSYFKKISIDVAAKVFLKQKLSKKLWAVATIFGTFPLSSNYKAPITVQFFQQSISFTIGLEYYLQL